LLLKVADRLEIRRQPVFFPVAITGWLKAAAAIGFLRHFGVLALVFGASRGGFGQGPFGGWGQQRFTGGRRLLFRVGWHRPRLGVAVRWMQPVIQGSRP
jgi:hypothetical protein